jgi:DGQHR domain-containing protein
MMSNTYPCISVVQPIGEFYVTSIRAQELVSRLRISARKDVPDIDGSTNTDVQRESSKKRIAEISTYVTDPDATFPTAIIISADSRYAHVSEGKIAFSAPKSTDVNAPAYANRGDASEFLFGELLDGQHRIKGLKLAMARGIDISNFGLPVVVMLDLLPAEKAYVFSIINSKQTPVPKSLIYDLFGLSTQRSPYLTCHEIARAMNTNEGGPFYRGIKMLGKRREITEMLTQGSFVKYLLDMITSTPDVDAIALKSGDVPKDNSRPFNAFFRNERDELILKTMQLFFSAIAQAFPDQWDISRYVTDEGTSKRPTPVFRRTVGYEALMRVLRAIWPEVKSENPELDERYFVAKAEELRRNVGEGVISTREYGSSSADAGKLYKLLLGQAQ